MSCSIATGIASVESMIKFQFQLSILMHSLRLYGGKHWGQNVALQICPKFPRLPDVHDILINDELNFGRKLECT
jgi:hypothetical protein